MNKQLNINDKYIATVKSIKDIVVGDIFVAGIEVVEIYEDKLMVILYDDSDRVPLSVVIDKLKDNNILVVRKI